LIHFQAIRYKNILSTGNVFTEIPLNKVGTTLIVGENGAGKSTILDALAFALYGKPFRGINKPQLINSINQKDMLVEIGFRTGGNQYVIRRGVKPNIFEIYKNNELIPQNANVKDYQDYLEQSILKMNFKSFGQIVVLGSSTFVPFMQLPASHRREIIEDLLDIQIFSTMNLLLKEKLQRNKEEGLSIKYQIDLYDERIKSAKEHNEKIREMKSAQIKDIEAEVSDVENKIKEAETQVEALNVKYEAMMVSCSGLSKAEKNKKELLKILDSLGDKIKKLEKDIKFYEINDSCPTCLQEMNPEHKASHIKQIQEKISGTESSIPLVEKKLSKIQTEISNYLEIESAAETVYLEKSNLLAELKIHKSRLEKLTSDIDKLSSAMEESDFADLESFKEEHSKYSKEYSDLLEEKEIMTTSSNLLKDGGIKTQIIRQYVPIINKLINKYLAEMDFFVQFELDEQFKETLKSRFRDDFSYESFSEGEKMRIDLALLFTWRAVSKLRNSTSTNLLIMDEVFDGSLDVNGMEEFMKIIRSITGESNIFVISHKTDQLVDRFDDVLKFEKVKNFSRIAA